MSKLLFKRVRICYWEEIPQGFSKDGAWFFRIGNYVVRHHPHDGEIDYTKVIGKIQIAVSREEVRNYIERKNTKLGSLL